MLATQVMHHPHTCIMPEDLQMIYCEACGHARRPTFFGLLVFLMPLVLLLLALFLVLLLVLFVLLGLALLLAALARLLLLGACCAAAERQPRLYLI